MPMRHGISKKAPPASPHPSPFIKFSPGLFVVLQAILYQTSFTLIRLLRKICIFKVKHLFVQLITGRFYFAVLCVFLRALFHSSVIMKLRINNLWFS